MPNLNDAMTYIANGAKTRRLGWHPRMIAYDFGAENGKLVAYLVKITDAYVLSERDKNANDWMQVG